tara:strand:+ start:1045 stop:2724 length:1680 start_codon:yes stop_codon:yes gene_type:complete
MKKIKISEQQARMLKDLGKTKVLKVTQEQYNRIVELEKINEGAPEIELAFRQNLSNAARKDFNSMKESEGSKTPEITELYESFISELYGVNENTEKKHDKLIKLMELAGLVNENRLVKEKFNDDKKIVEYVMREALYEIHNGCSEYKAMEIIEQQLELFKDLRPGEVVNVDDESYKERVEDWLDNNSVNTNDNYLYFKNQYKNGNYKEAFRDITRLKETNEPIEEVLSENESQIIGNEIINYEPFVNLPETRDEVDWSNRGEAKLPSLKDGDVSMSILEKETVKQWIAAFINEYKEEPIFNIIPEVSRYRPIKVEVVNQSFNDWQDNYISGKASELEKFSSKDEATTAGSSGSYVGPMGGAPIHKTNVVDELINDEVSDVETEIDPETEILHDVVDLLSSVINSPSVKPMTINKRSYVLVKAINALESIDTDNIMFSKFLPDLIIKLIDYSRNISDDGIFEKYIHHIKHVYQVLKELKKDINVMPFPYDEDLSEQGIGNSGGYDTPGFVNPEMKGDTPRGTGPTWKKPTIAGGKEVKVKEKCSEFPYCNQGPDAIEISK